MANTPSILETLAPLFKPATVAIIGASRTRGKHGNTSIRYLQRAGYAGEIFPINSAGGSVEELTAYQSLRAVPKRIDCALMVIPAAGAVEAMRDCAQAGVRAVVMANTGFSELGSDEGRQREAQVRAIARESGIRIVGPNTNGIYNAHQRLSLGYNISHGDPLMPGPVSIAAHSGALFNSIAPRFRELGCGLSKYVAVGTEADLTVLDLFEYYVEDPDTRIIGLILESVSDGERFRALARRAREAGKPVVALKLGRSAAGAGATIAHSTRLAGSARAYDAIFERCGIAHVPSVESLAGGCATLASRTAVRRGERSRALVAIATTGGGASLLADYAEVHGMPLAGERDGAWGGSVAKLMAGFGNAGIVRNPTDTGALGGHDRLGLFLQAQEADGFDGPMIVYTHMLPNLALSQLVARVLVERRQRNGSPIVVVAPGSLPQEVADIYRRAGIPLFLDTDTCFHSLACHYQTLRRETPGTAPRPVTNDSIAAFAARSGVLSELESAAILRAAGVPMVESRTAASPDQAAAAADALGYPVVLKALAPGVAHKNRLGFVATSLADERSLRMAYEKIGTAVAAHDFDRRSVIFIVQPMKRSAVELIAGVSLEPPFGHFLVAGLGGIYAEALDESCLLPADLDRDAMRERLARTRLGRVLGAMGPAPFDGLLTTLEALQGLVLAHGERIESIDVNPLLADLQGCVAVDALVVLR